MNLSKYWINTTITRAMKARQNSDDSTKAYERDAKMTPATKGTGTWHYFRVLGELILVLLFLVSSLLIVLTIMQG